MVARVERREVVLSGRASARLGEERDQQRAQKPHDIRRSIPLVAWTDPAAFPPYAFREYPKMPLLDGNKPIQIDESGTLLVFYDLDDEKEFLEANPELAEEIDRNAPTKQYASALAAKDNELSELRQRLIDAGLNPDAGKRKAAAPSPLLGLVREEPADAGGLRDQVRAAAGNTAKPSNPLRHKSSKAKDAGHAVEAD